MMRKQSKRTQGRARVKNSTTRLRIAKTKVATKKRKIVPIGTKVRSALRKLWMWSPERRAALSAARISRGIYRCDGCRVAVTSQFIAVDHTVACVPLSGWDSWDGFITRLFCDPSGLQVLCQRCHEQKSCQEKESRKTARQKAKMEITSSFPSRVRKVG